jgi:23S rRNA pseudouridine1911/1915/1917 synthase
MYKKHCTDNKRPTLFHKAAKNRKCSVVQGLILDLLSMNASEEEELQDISQSQEDELYIHHHFVVDKGQQPLRIDVFLTNKITNATRNKVQQAAESGLITVNDKVIKQNYKVKPGDVVKVLMPHPKATYDLTPENIPLDIVYEDDDVILVNKPAGMVVHPGSGNYSGTLVNALSYHFQQLPNLKGNENRPGLVHRIDKNTSGLLIIAKTEFAMAHLAKQFYYHTINRKYIALVWGTFDKSEGTIIGNIGRNKRYRMMMDVYPDGDEGKEAITHYKVIQKFTYTTLLECKLETGRTHQIRVHMKHIGHPIFNDETYGGDRIVKGTVYSRYKQFVENCFAAIPRHALHAASLGFIHPRNGEYMYFEVPIPADMQAVIDKWQNFSHHSTDHT